MPVSVRRVVPPEHLAAVRAGATLPAVVDTASATTSKTVVHAEAPDNSVFNWHLGDKDATEKAFKAAKHVTKLDLVNYYLAIEEPVMRALERRPVLLERFPAASDASTRSV